MIYLKKYVFCLLFLICSIPALWAQEEDFGKWLVYFGNQKINNKWLLQSDVQYRLNQTPEQKSQLLLRAGLGYNLTEANNNILLGIAYIESNLLEGDVTMPSTNEKRIYQQYLYKQKRNNLFITHRVRMEERFLADELLIVDI